MAGPSGRAAAGQGGAGWGWACSPGRWGSCLHPIVNQNSSCDVTAAVAAVHTASKAALAAPGPPMPRCERLRCLDRPWEMELVMKASHSLSNEPSGELPSGEELACRRQATGGMGHEDSGRPSRGSRATRRLASQSAAGGWFITVQLVYTTHCLLQFPSRLLVQPHPARSPRTHLRVRQRHRGGCLCGWAAQDALPLCTVHRDCCVGALLIHRHRCGEAAGGADACPGHGVGAPRQRLAALHLNPFNAISRPPAHMGYGRPAGGVSCVISDATDGRQPPHDAATPSERCRQRSNHSR